MLITHPDRDEKVRVREPEQFLTKDGEDKAENAANKIREFLSLSGVPPGLVFSSPYLAALQTARIVTKLLGPQTISLADALAPREAGGRLDKAIELIKAHVIEPTLLIVGHNPQLARLVQRLTPKTESLDLDKELDRGGVLCIKIDSLDQPGKIVHRIPPPIERTPRRVRRTPRRFRLDHKDVLGMLSTVMALVTFLSGGLLLYMSTGALRDVGGEGGIAIAVKGIVEVKGVNGALVMFLSGICFILTPLGLVKKAYQEAIDKEGGVRDTIRHMV